jgi:hypothetical protein
MSGVINTSSFAKALWPGVNAWYGESYKEFETQWDKLFDKSTSRRAWEEDVGTSMFGLPVVKAEGSPVTFDTSRQGFTSRYNHVVYALGFIITREMVDDDLYDIVGRQKAKSLAFSMRQNKEIIAANVYNRAFNTSYVGGDSATLVASAGGGGSTSHPNIAGGTWTNGPVAAADLSEAALEQAAIDIRGFLNDRGLKINAKPKRLVVPKELMFEAQRILKTDGQVYSADNTMNALKTMGIIPEIVVNDYLTDADAWFIRTDVQDGMKYFERNADEFGMDEDWDTENAKYKARSRFSFGWSDARGVYGSPGQ